MKKNTIAIIGGGACGVATFIHLVLKIVIEPLPAPVSLHIIEKNDEFGPGLAYGTGQQAHLLNTPAYLMGIFAEENLHFVEWMEQNRNWIEENYPGTEIHPQSYPPRNLYGRYLTETFEEYARLARKQGVEVVLHRDEAIDATVNKKSVRLKLASGKSLRATVAVLATGTPRSNNFTHLEASAHYLDSPWPVERVHQTVTNPQATVGILGASLTAIDAAMTLTDNGHTGPIRFFSKDGLLPRVQPPKEVPFDRQLLTLAAIRKLVRQQQQPLRIKELFRLFLAEAERVLGPQDSWKHVDRIGQPPLALLEEDIHLALKGENQFQNILYSTRYESFPIWQLLPADQKLMFIKWLKSLSDINRHAIPLINAMKVRDLLKSGQLTVSPHLKDVNWDSAKKQFVVTTEDEEPFWADYMINATGPATALEKMDIPLLQQLAKKKQLIPYEPGGVQADVQTMQIVVPGVPDAPLYGIGHLLVGELFDTNSVWFNVARIDQLTNDILKRLKHGSSH
ncbi:FAD/NAD(P)-binding protein [Larkinella harenae]